MPKKLTKIQKELADINEKTNLCPNCKKNKRKNNFGVCEKCKSN